MPMQHRRARARVAAITGGAAVLAAAAALVVAGPAAAHVHVDGDAEPGERATVSFRVPTESDTASTTSVVVTLPTDTPITSARPQAKPGWRTEIGRVDLDPPAVSGDVTITSAIRTVTWTATGDGIAPGEFDDFVVQLGPIPDVASLALPTRQGYSDGTSVDWSQRSEGTAEPEHPAPLLAVGGSAAGAPGLGLAIGGLVAGIAGLLAGVLAIVLAVGASRRSRTA